MGLPSEHSLLKTHGVLLVVQFCWASLTIFAKVALDHMNPGVFLTLRMCGSLPFFFLAAYFADRASWSTSDALSVRNIVVGSLLGVFCFWSNQSTFMYGLALTTPTNAAVLMLLIPIWTCAICILLGREEKSWIKFVGIFITIAGAITLLEIESLEVSGDTMTGNLLVILTTVLYTTYIVIGKPLCSQIPPFTLALIMFAASAVMCILYIFIYWEHWTKLSEVPLEAWGSVFIATFVGTFLTYGLTTWALRQAPETTVVMYGPVELIFTGIMATTLLGERLTWRLLLGSSGIVAGLFIVIYALDREAKARQAEEHERRGDPEFMNGHQAHGTKPNDQPRNETTPLLLA